MPDDKCKRCNGTKVISVLGGGGDYETWPCPDCRPEEYQDTLRQQYGHGGYDGEGD